MEFIENELGFEFKDDKKLIFFGKKNANLDNLKQKYQELNFVKLKQTHSDKVLYSQHIENCQYQVDLNEADAHLTKDVNLALCIVTADCIPIFLHDEKLNIVAGIHAGWRGVANLITALTINELKKQSSSIEKLKVYIGPHIQKHSFETEEDVSQKILSSVLSNKSLDATNYFKLLSNGKKLIDLNAVLKQQLISTGVTSKNIYSMDLDTMTDHRFHSYRRDKGLSGRQISFISRI